MNVNEDKDSHLWTMIRTKRNDAVAAVVDMIREGEEYGLSDDDIYTFKEGELEGKEEMDERGELWSLLNGMKHFFIYKGKQ